MSVPRIKPLALRALAEAALGGREHPQGIICDPGNPAKLTVIPRAATNAGATAASDEHEYIIEIDAMKANQKNGALRVVLPDVFLDGDKVPDDDYASIADALFWSAAAIDKFVLPYYASFVDLAVLREKVVDAFQQPDVLAIVHLPDSETVIIDDLLKSVRPNLWKVTVSDGKINVVDLF